MWKFLFESIAGTSHQKAESICQDSSFATKYIPDVAEEVLFLVCSDGAGSAPESHIGSALACKAITGQAVSFLDGGNNLNALTDDILRAWSRSAHEELVAEAERRNLQPRELACTLLFALIGKATAAFAQIGDGAIVVVEGKSYKPVFWPQTGEYQNTTFFLTDPRFDGHLQLAIVDREVEEVAMFTDGLQMLALNYATKTVHEPFFAPMFQNLRDSDSHDLIIPMRQFLNSSAVNDRTDDDKTLILATRINERAKSTV